ncbi:MAG TPA: isocitrate/isopropylmalate dehydrogenase family protein [Anaerolineales bacterium]|nr:isocitrate/isopropylmalate dehydrogenase family protein [Anaerolineae bacterium]HIQ02664.1 isocitrate/isopropylmalate dehydrogenase family protein [Anaerolineales bacterium]
MAKYRIALMPGDGIGKDVMDAAQIVLEKIALDAEYIPADIGWEFWCKEGDALPQRTVETLKTCNCALFAAITSKPKEEAEAELVPELQGKGLVYRSPIVRLRQMFDLYVNLRPCKAFKGNPLNFRDDLDLVVFRENTQGLYAGVEFHPLPEEVRGVLEAHSPRMSAFEGVPSDEIALSCRIFTREGCRRIVRAAFEYAKKFGYPTVTLVEKPNVIRETSGMMVREARKIAEEYPGIELWETNVDAMAMWLVKNPQDYGVLVSSNMFGDIVSDLCAQLVGGLGFAAAGNIGDEFAVFEPTHGSAPKYAGLYKVNPTAMLLAIKLMLDWLGETETAQSLEQAIAAVIEEGRVRTYDMGGDASTLDMARAVADRL